MKVYTTTSALVLHSGKPATIEAGTRLAEDFDMSIEVTLSPRCPVCEHNDEVLWLSTVQRRGEVVAESWSCLRCDAVFGIESWRSHSKEWAAALALAAAALIWWRRRRHAPRLQRAA